MQQLKKWFGIFSAIMLFNFPASAQDELIKMLNANVHKLKYVFEARIDSVQTFAGDSAGNPIPFGRAEWKGEGGNFYAMSYSRVWVTACRQYKGKLPEKMILLISNPEVSMYAIAHGGDTTLGWIHSPPSHGSKGSPLMPSKGYPITNLYWCFDVAPIAKTGYYKMNEFCALPMKIIGDIPNAHGYWNRGIIYAFTGTRTFMNQEELSEYLKQIKTIKPNPRSQCE